MITLKISNNGNAYNVLLMLNSRLRQAGILLDLFPIKALLRQCKRLFQQRHKETISIVKTSERNGCCMM